MSKLSTALALTFLAMGAALLPGNKTVFSAPRESPRLQAATDESSLEQQIVAKEREGLEALKAGNVQHFGELTADEAVMVDAHGPAGKTQVLNNVAGFTLSDFAMEDVRFVPISSNTGLITYKINEKGNSHGKDFSAQAYVSSVWTRRGDKWLCLFSQETAAR